MGNLRDKLLSESKTWGEYSSEVMTAKSSKRAIREVSHALPAPWHARGKESEADILLATKAWLKVNAPWFRRIEVSGLIVWGAEGEGRYAPSGMAGMADLLALIDGAFWALELKAPGGRIKGSQLAELQTIYRAGGKSAILCTSKSIETLIADFRANQLRLHPVWGIPVY